jgi:hypothetical protein
LLTLTKQLLIASPSDLSEERNKIVQAICEWNIENSSKGIAFSPLLWEWHAVPDLDKAPQEAINEQLLSRADFIIAAFKGRMGTPTKDYPAGTLEELSKRTGKAAVFFPKKWPLLDYNEPNFEEMESQLKALIGYKKQLQGFTRDYEGPSEIINKIKQTLTNWAEENCEKLHPFLLLQPGPYDPKELLRQVELKGEKVCILLYNTELFTLKNKEDFENYWKFLHDKREIQKVILLIPPFKIDRLKNYLQKSTSDAEPELLGKFYVCSIKNPDIQIKLGSSSSLAFALHQKQPPAKVAMAVLEG